MQLIADILSFQDNQDALLKHIKHSEIDWDSAVVIGSKHLMIPALYCRLKEKELLSHLPDDLNLYLEEIANINRRRNEILLQEAHEISHILNKENIEYVFIKGIALLAGDTYKDQAERMIGDMDILVAHDQINNAFRLLTQNGYIHQENRDYISEESRHLARQICPNKLGAVELHREVLRHKYKQLVINKQVIKKRRIINGIAVPSIEDSIKISILSLQINDHAHVLGYLNFKTIYDCSALNLSSNKILIKDLSEQNYSQTFLNIASVFFKELTPYNSSYYSKLLKGYFLFRLNHPKFGFLLYSILRIIKINSYRLTIFLQHKSYRKYVLNKKVFKN